MQTDSYLSQKSVELFKQAARKLKRARQIPYRLALENIAQSHGFPNWKCVTVCRNTSKDTEVALRSGLILAFDTSQKAAIALRLAHSKAVFVEDAIASELCRNQLIERSASRQEGAATQDQKENVSADDLSDVFYCRYTGSRVIKTVSQALKLADKHLILPPRIVWIKGRCYNTLDIQAAGSKLTRYGFFEDNNHEAPNQAVIDRIRQEVIGKYLLTRLQQISLEISSYRLKHVFEDLLGVYVGNGDCIQAMQASGFKVKPFGDGNPNAAFNLSKREFKALEAAAHEAVDQRQSR